MVVLVIMQLVVVVAQALLEALVLVRITRMVVLGVLVQALISQELLLIMQLVAVAVADLTLQVDHLYMVLLVQEEHLVLPILQH
jgi:hypothetical protein